MVLSFLAEGARQIAGAAGKRLAGANQDGIGKEPVRRSVARSGMRCFARFAHSAQRNCRCNLSDQTWCRTCRLHRARTRRRMFEAICRSGTKPIPPSARPPGREIVCDGNWKARHRPDAYRIRPSKRCNSYARTVSGRPCSRGAIGIAPSTRSPRTAARVSR